MPRSRDSAIDRKLQDLALLVAVNCVRNTVIENYHAAGKISDPEMKAFNIEVVNRIYTALQYLMNPRLEGERDAFLKLISFAFPDNWNRPEIDPGMVPDEWFLEKFGSKKSKKEI